MDLKNSAEEKQNDWLRLRRLFFYYTNIYMNIFTVGVLFYELECENKICLFLTGLLNGGEENNKNLLISRTLP